MTDYRGIFPILPTPFTDDGRIDEESLVTLVKFMQEHDVDGLTVLGMMGEAPKLTEAEQDLVIETVVAAADGLPVIVGTGSASSHLSSVRSQKAADLGAAGFLVAPPPTQDENALFDYYAVIADSVEGPVFLHDYPDVTGVKMSVPLVSKMGREIPGVEYIKLEEAPTGKKITRLLADESHGLRVFAALGGVYCLEELRRGAIGIMTGFAFPEVLKEIYQRHVDGDAAGAERVFYQYLPLIRYEFQPGLGLPLRKEIYRRRGAIRSSHVRAPGPALDQVHPTELSGLLAYLELEGA